MSFWPHTNEMIIRDFLRTCYSLPKQVDNLYSRLIATFDELLANNALKNLDPLINRCARFILSAAL